MLKRKLLNSEILRVLAYMGAGDQIIVSSANFPIVEGVDVIDLSLMRGVPTIEQVVEVLSDEVLFDMATISEEVKADNEEFTKAIENICDGIRVDLQTYRQVKVVSKNAIKVIRTGDEALYKSVVLRVAQ